MSRPRPITPRHPHVLLLEVVRSERISPNFQRVTVGGAALDLFEPMGRDQWFRLFIPHHPDEKPALPASAGARWWPQVLAMPEARRPFVRNYTVAGHRAADRELDIDFVLHESPGGHDAAAGRPSTAPSMSPYGVASDWAAEAVPGRLVGLLDQGVMWNPPADTHHILVATDETGLPAAAGIARDLPRDATGMIVVEVPTLADSRHLEVPEGVEVRWLSREGTDAVTGALALADASAAALPASGLYAYVVGEQALVTGARRALVARGVPKSHITFCGYWRR